MLGFSMLNLVLSLALLHASRTSGSAGLSVGVDLYEIYAFDERLRARDGVRFLVLYHVTCGVNSPDSLI
jgi:hypothetical protein